MPFLGPLGPLAARLIAAALFGLSLLAFGFYKGCEHVQDAWDLAAAKAETDSLNEIIRVQTVGNKRVKELQREKAKLETQRETTKQKIPTYIPPAADRACVLPVGFVWLLDEARLGMSVSRDSAGAANAPSGIALSAATDVIADNYNRFNQMKLQCQKLIDWYNNDVRGGRVKEK